MLTQGTVQSKKRVRPLHSRKLSMTLTTEEA